jgi:hypothetical protein
VAVSSSNNPTPTILDSARAWLKRGHAPVVIERNSKKKPKYEGWQDRFYTEAELPQFFSEDVLVGVLLGRTDDVKKTLADVDKDCFEAIRASKFLLPPTGLRFGRKSKPDSHAMYLVFPGTTTKQFKDPYSKKMMVELRCTSGKATTMQTVVPYSIHAASGETIQFESGHYEEPATISGEDLQLDVARVAAAALLARYYPDSSRNETELALAGTLARAGWPEDDAIHFILATYKSVESHDPNAYGRVETSVKSTFASFKADDPVTGYTRLKELYGDSSKAVETAMGWLRLAIEEASAALTAVDDANPWRSQLIYIGKPPNTYLAPNTANVATTLQNVELWKDCFAYDEFGDRVVLLKDCPVHPKLKQGPTEDYHELLVMSALQHGDFPLIGKATVQDAVTIVARENSFHPVRDYLNSLPAWDGTPRLDTFLHAYLGAENNQVNTIIGRKFLVSMVARVIDPGCQVDHMLVLEGIQGKRKSTLLRDGLTPNPDWFTDHLPEIGTKDALIQLQGKWLIEVAELDRISGDRIEWNRVKAFITSRTNVFRPPFGRRTQAYDRQCVFVGTSNDDEYLRDETGNRRFWPVACTGTINLDALIKDRDQIWAEALALYTGPKDNPRRAWWPINEQEEQLLTIEQEKRFKEPSVTDKVIKWCEDPRIEQSDSYTDDSNYGGELLSVPGKVRMDEIIQHVFNKPPGVNKPEEMLISSILKSKKWKRMQITCSDKDRRWFYVSPRHRAPDEPPKKTPVATSDELLALTK